jgi:hypothetical protein
MYHMDGAPWNWTTWKDITGIQNGIFPTDDTLLPRGLTRRDIVEIQSYFNQYQAQPTEDAKQKFVSQNKANPLPGRSKSFSIKIKLTPYQVGLNLEIG